MMQLTKLDRVIRRQRQQVLSMLVTYGLFVGGAALTATSLAGADGPRGTPLSARAHLT